MTVNRCSKPSGFGDASSCELHHLSDTSQVGYGAVTYLRLVNESSQIHCTFVMSKARVVPLKKITIPRLELSTATVSVRLDKMITRELKLAVDRSFFSNRSYIGAEVCSKQSHKVPHVCGEQVVSDP